MDASGRTSTDASESVVKPYASAELPDGRWVYVWDEDCIFTPAQIESLRG